MNVDDALETMPLWPDGHPNHTGQTVTVYYPSENIQTGRGVIVFPGGGRGGGAS